MILYLFFLYHHHLWVFHPSFYLFFLINRHHCQFWDFWPIKLKRIICIRIYFEWLLSNMRIHRRVVADWSVCTWTSSASQTIKSMPVQVYMYLPRVLNAMYSKFIFAKTVFFSLCMAVVNNSKNIHNALLSLRAMWLKVWSGARKDVWSVRWVSQRALCSLFC